MGFTFVSILPRNERRINCLSRTTMLCLHSMNCLFGPDPWLVKRGPVVPLPSRNQRAARGIRIRVAVAIEAGFDLQGQGEIVRGSTTEARRVGDRFAEIGVRIRTLLFEQDGRPARGIRPHADGGHKRYCVYILSFPFARPASSNRVTRARGGGGRSRPRIAARVCAGCRARTPKAETAAA